MTKPALHRIGAFVAVSFLTLSLLTACDAEANDRAAAEAYIRANVSDLSPTPAVLGGTFQVTDIEWENADTAVVSFEDGHIALKGRTKIAKGEHGTVTVEGFTIVDAEGGSASSASTGSGSASSVAERPRAKEGELCGGIAGILCDFGLMCQYDGAYPDAAGVCVQ